MYELDLYKFVTENSLEYHWGQIKKDKGNVYLLVTCADIGKFIKLIENIIQEKGVKCTIFKQGTFSFEMNGICEYYGIETERVFAKLPK